MRTITITYCKVERTLQNNWQLVVFYVDKDNKDKRMNKGLSNEQEGIKLKQFLEELCMFADNYRIHKD